jgi:uracil-DNA glycosylase
MATRLRKPRPPRAVPEGSAPEPVDDSLAALRDAALGCKRCPLWKPATQTVFGEGPANARVLVVGEQPGNDEDLAGRPFVGPAGRMFDKALEELGIDRGRVYVTNAVKHFKFERRGKVRLHRSPDPGEQRACRVWLEGELARIRPDVVVCLGAIAARNVLGTKFKLMQQRGTWQALPDGTRAIATVHPSWVLRQRDSESRAAAYRSFVTDLAALVDLL